jgi:hypothetical protein
VLGRKALVHGGIKRERTRLKTRTDEQKRTKIARVTRRDMKGGVGVHGHEEVDANAETAEHRTSIWG